MYTAEERKSIETEILKHKSPYDARQEFAWDGDTVSFSGYLYINSNATLPALTTIGGYLYIHSDATLKADALTTIGGSLCIYSDATLKADALVNKNFTANMADGEIKHGLLKADEIVMVVAKSRKLNGITVYYAPYPMVCVAKGGTFAHGKTAHEAMQDLNFKLAKRNIDEYRNLKLDSVVSYDEAIMMYRVITGACSFGTNQFLESAKPEKRSYTIAEILEKTKGQYGSGTLAEFFASNE